MASVAPFLWFHDDAEEALAFYARVFTNSEIVEVMRMDVAEAPFTIGTIRIEGLTVTIMSGGPTFSLTEAFSLVVSCDDQAEVDYYWAALSDGGELGQCGWLKDRFGLSWQIVPEILTKLLSDPNAQRAARVRDAMLAMTKLECDVLQDAYDQPVEG